MLGFSSGVSGLSPNGSFDFNDHKKEIRVISSVTGKTSPYKEGSKKGKPIHVVTMYPKEGISEERFDELIDIAEKFRKLSQKKHIIKSGDEADHIAELHCQEADAEAETYRSHMHLAAHNQGKLKLLIEICQSIGLIREDVPELKEIFDKIKNNSK